MLKKKMALALGLAMLVGSGTAWAGYKQSFSVYIYPPNNYFGGVMGSARNSTDTLQYLDAGFQVSQSGLYHAYLYARDASGNSATCSTTDPKLVEVVRAVTTDSALNVYHDGLGTCVTIEVRTSSYNEPKLP